MFGVGLLAGAVALAVVAVVQPTDPAAAALGAGLTLIGLSIGSWIGYRRAFR